MKAYLSIFLVLSAAAAVGKATDRPVIGVLAQGTYGHFAQFGNMYIAASYVKFLESAGARVVPIFNNLTSGEAAEAFKVLHGVLLPGGGAGLNDSGYARNSKIFVDLAMSAKEDGEYFPIWGTCRGMEELLAMRAGNSVFDFFEAKNDSLSLKLENGYQASRLLGHCPADVLSWLQNDNLTMNYHRLGITPEKFMSTPDISGFYDLLATSQDRAGRAFVSVMEAKQHPIYATIFHPEKSIFEWRSNLAINHSPHAVRAAQYFANFFVDETRKSVHKFPADTPPTVRLIYNFSPIYTGSFNSLYEQCYFF